MLRVIRELSPTWVVGENVSGLLSINDGMEIEHIISQLEGEGYEVCPLHYPAAGVGAWHRRDRVFIVGYSKHNGQSATDGYRKAFESSIQAGEKEVGQSKGTSHMADSECLRKLQPEGSEQDKRGWVSDKGRGGIKSRLGRVAARLPDWLDEIGLPRVAVGVKNRVDRLKCLGNAVVPKQAYPIFKAIAGVERDT